MHLLNARAIQGNAINCRKMQKRLKAKKNKRQNCQRYEQTKISKQRPRIAHFRKCTHACPVEPRYVNREVGFTQIGIQVDRQVYNLHFRTIYAYPVKPRQVHRQVCISTRFQLRTNRSDDDWQDDTWAIIIRFQFQLPSSSSLSPST